MPAMPRRKARGQSARTSSEDAAYSTLSNLARPPLPTINDLELSKLTPSRSTSARGTGSARPITTITKRSATDERPLYAEIQARPTKRGEQGIPSQDSLVHPEVHGCHQFLRGWSDSQCQPEGDDKCSDTAVGNDSHLSVDSNRSLHSTTCRRCMDVDRCCDSDGKVNEPMLPSSI